MVHSSRPGLTVWGLAVLILSWAFSEAAHAHSYTVCFAKRAQICQDFFPPSKRAECVISAIGSCGTHSHEGGGFVPVEFPFGATTFPDLDAMLEDETVSAEEKAIAREALEAYRLYEEARAREYNAILRLQSLTEEGSEYAGQGQDAKE
jgi:hypothetical protein